jgi:hypothetical protein
MGQFFDFLAKIFLFLTGRLKLLSDFCTFKGAHNRQIFFFDEIRHSGQGGQNMPPEFFGDQKDFW